MEKIGKFVQNLQFSARQKRACPAPARRLVKKVAAKNVEF